MDGDLDVAAPQAVAHLLAQSRLKHFKTFGQTQTQIEEAVIDAAQGHAEQQTIVFAARLRT